MRTDDLARRLKEMFPAASGILRVREALAQAADGDCPECGGDGVVSVSWNNNPDRCEDVACECTHRADDEPTDDEAWSGGFADNH